MRILIILMGFALTIGAAHAQQPRNVTVHGYVDMFQTGDKTRGANNTPRLCSFVYVNSIWRAVSHDHPSAKEITAKLMLAKEKGYRVVLYFTGKFACSHDEIDLVNTTRQNTSRSRISSSSRRMRPIEKPRQLSDTEILDALDELNRRGS